MANWFQNLLGFPERHAADVKAHLALDDGGNQGDFAALVAGADTGRAPRLRSGANGQDFAVGHFSTPSLSELRELGRLALADTRKVELAGLRGAPSVEHAVGDVSHFHSVKANRYALFQVASQFNCLEFVSPSSTPEMGITGYTSDRTQGPSCAVACGPGTVYRNYFAPVRNADGHVIAEGQSTSVQLECLRELDTQLGQGVPGRYFAVRGGYTMGNDAGLRAMNERLRALGEGGLDALRGLLRVGVQADTEVTSRDWGRQLLRDPDQLVTQVFGSACSVAYSGNGKDLWEPFARLILEASYEATLWAAVLCALRHGGAAGSRRVFLTSLGGGVFGNSMTWVADAIDRAVSRVCTDNGLALQVFLVSYAPPVHATLEAVVERCRAGRFAPSVTDLQDTLQYDIDMQDQGAPASAMEAHPQLQDVGPQDTMMMETLPFPGDVGQLKCTFMEASQPAREDERADAVAQQETLLYDDPLRPAAAPPQLADQQDETLAYDGEAGSAAAERPVGERAAQRRKSRGGAASSGDLRAAFAASAASSGLCLADVAASEGQAGGCVDVEDDSPAAGAADAGSAPASSVLGAFNLRASRWQHLPEPGTTLAALDAAAMPVGMSQECNRLSAEALSQLELAAPRQAVDWNGAVPLLVAPVPLLPSGKAIFAQLPADTWLDFSGRADALGTRCLFASRRHEHSIFAPLPAEELIQLPLAARAWQPPLAIPAPPADAATAAYEEPWSVEIHPGQGSVRVLLRPNVLLLRMLRRGTALPSATFTWRALDASAPDSIGLGGDSSRRCEAMGEFSILSNVEDAAHPQPPHFKEFPLRREQLRSLGWMVSQERRRKEPFAAELRETVVCADAPHWKLQGCLRCEYRDVKGGVLADAIGYGKTACTIGLIDCMRSEALPSVPSAFRGFLPTRATLVLAPTNLHGQWLAEITKFTGNTLKVLSVPTYAQLKKLSVQDVIEADVIVATYRLFYSTPYLRRLEELARSQQADFSFPSTKASKDGGAAAQKQSAEWASAYRRAVEKLPAACAAAGCRVDPVTPVTPVRPTQSATQSAAADDETPEQVAPMERPARRRKLDKAPPRKDPIGQDGAPVDAQAGAAGEAEMATQCYMGAPPDPPQPDEPAATLGELESGRKRRLVGKQAATQPDGSEQAAAQPGRTSLGSAKKAATAAVVQAKYLPLEAFWWRRVVCDEFHELLSRYPPAQVAVENFHADYKWGLSGTPPCRTLAEIRKAAGFLGVQLPSTSAAEEGGQAARRVAQEWLDAFARRNTAELAPLAEEERIVPVHQTPKERALYLALTDQQRAPLPTVEQSGPAAERLDEPPELHAARQSASGLLKLCSHFCTSGAAEVLSAEDECQRQLALRREQLRMEEREARALADRAANTARLVRHFEAHWCQKPDPKDYGYLRSETAAVIKSRLRLLGAPADGKKAELLPRLLDRVAECGDDAAKEASLRIDFDPQALAACAGSEGDVAQDATATPRISYSAWPSLEAAATAEQPAEQGAPGADQEASGRERIRCIAKEVFAAFAERSGAGAPLPPRCTRLRSDLGMPKWPTAAQLAAAKSKGEDGAEQVWSDFREADWAWRADPENGARLRKVVDAWKADAEKSSEKLLSLAGTVGERLHAVRSFQHTLHASQQGTLDAVETRAEPTRQFAKYGSKIESIVKHVQTLQREDPGCKIICFVQWEDLKRKVVAALDEFKVGNLTLSGSVWKRRAALTQFQYEEGGPRMLLLSLEESASGTNLTAANHVIIVHPMEAATREEAVAFEMQAVGRVRRPGQQRKIHIWRFVTVGTIEQSITEEHQQELWERQQAKIMVMQPGQPDMESGGEEADAAEQEQEADALPAAGFEAYMPALAAQPHSASKPRAGARASGGGRRRSRSQRGGHSSREAEAASSAHPLLADGDAAELETLPAKQLAQDESGLVGMDDPWAQFLQPGMAADATQRY